MHKVARHDFVMLVGTVQITLRANGNKHVYLYNTVVPMTPIMSTGWHWLAMELDPCQQHSYGKHMTDSPFYYPVMREG